MKLLIAILLLIGFAATAADLSIKASAFPSGGGQSVGSRFGVKGTLGQPDTTMAKPAGSRFGVRGGFQALVIALQTPGAPSLTVTLSDGNATIAWPAEFTGWALEQSNLVGPGASWSVTSGVVNNSVTVSVPSGTRYFRLTRETSE